MCDTSIRTRSQLPQTEMQAIDVVVPENGRSDRFGKPHVPEVRHYGRDALREVFGLCFVCACPLHVGRRVEAEYVQPTTGKRDRNPARSAGAVEIEANHGIRSEDVDQIVVSRRQKRRHAPLAAAFTEAGDFLQAVHWQQKAIELADESDKAELQERLELYKTRRPYRTQPAR